ncbi:P27 family predicted phage terminase small subunit [Scopulibacillus darangshiensis]|uniref:P27 family predicted phage terminase small subunit n=1 Tax=Scopulibacillus darangshiensis TaxID=442528 RepID=A0A4V2SNR4_9BACL|nr:phage terminase small subunit P27 family [Scopulibacillus darangshiensis]TCP32176.1 P27 family predicted phage terminase small subunit [Scopulibacillus darangshiensis]
MPGRNKQPLAVIQGKGKSHHLTKDEISKRKKQEDAMNGFTDNIAPPKYLTKVQKREFEEIAKELLRLNIFSNLDVDSLARYIDSRDQYIQLIKNIKKVKPTIEAHQEDGTKITIANDDYPKLMRTKNLLFNECRSAAGDLGLTITSRLKLVIPKTEYEKPKSEAERRFGGRL